MKLFLWRQKYRQIESSILLKWAVEEYETMKQNQEPYRESELDSLFEFVSERNTVDSGENDSSVQFQIVKLPGGKPVVLDVDGSEYPVHVSVTHTGDWWICAVGDHPMGIDAELKERKVNASLMRRICSDDELLWLEAELADMTEEQRREQLRRKLLWLWVRKEAYVKYLGTGIGEGLKTFSVVDNDGAGGWKEKNGFQAVDVMEELELAVYSPDEEIEEILWRKW